MKLTCAMLGCARSCNINKTLCDVHFARVLERGCTPLTVKRKATA